MTDKPPSQGKLSTTEVVSLLKISRASLHYYMRQLRGLLNVSKDSSGRYEFTKDQIDVLKRHIAESRRIRTLADEGDDIARFLNRLQQVQGLRQELTAILGAMEPLLEALTKTPAAAVTLHTLPLGTYRLAHPVRVLVYPHGRRFRASLPEARLLVEEATRENALLALRADLLRAYLELPPSPPIDDPRSAERWHVLHALIVPVSTIATCAKS